MFATPPRCPASTASEVTVWNEEYLSRQRSTICRDAADWLAGAGDSLVDPSSLVVIGC
jgi:hypothetical protein